MKAVAYRLRGTLRTRWPTTLVLTAIVAVMGGLVITFAAGAQRTTSVPARYTQSVGGAFDAEVTQEEGGRPRTEEVRSLPGVARADSYTFVFGGLVAPGAPEPMDAVVFSGSQLAVGAKLVSGRSADPAVEGEFVATPSFVAQAGAALGDQFDLVTYTQEQGDSGAYGIAPPAGPSLTATLVGVVDGPGTIEDPTPLTVFSAALLERPEIGVSQTKIVVRLDDGVSVDQFRTALNTLPDSAELSIGPAEIISAQMRRAIDTQGRGLWILAIVSGIAAIAVLGQIITRQVRLSIGERQQLAAIGYTGREALAESVLRASLPIVVGCVLGAISSVAFSGLFPTGFIRQIEPDPGLRVELAATLVAAAVLIGALLLWTAVSLVLTRSGIRSVRPSPTLEALTSHSASPAASVGLRFAFTRAKGERGSVRAALAGVMLAVGGLVAAITFGVSVNRLIDEPYRYGTNYDVAMGDNGGEEIDQNLAADLTADPDVISLMFYAGSYGRVGTTTVPLSGLHAIRGQGTPAVLAGRLPSGDDEISLGRVTAHDVGAGVGDELTLTGPTGTRTFRVTGIVVVAGLGANEGIGEGGVVTLRGLAGLDESAKVVTALVRFQPGSEGIEKYAKYAAAGAEPPDDTFVPAAISNIARVRTIPFVVAGVLALLAVLTVAHAMLTSVRARRRDLAVLRSLGADRGFVSRVVHWQATAFTIVPALIAVPLGFIVGRAVFTAYANGIGAISDAAVPALIVSGVLIAVVVLANVVATLAAHRVRRTPPAVVLQSE
jgi:putative ABC transport system permease protein